jgi:cytochrome c oxidase subunit IV
VGVHLRVLLSVVGGGMDQAVHNQAVEREPHGAHGDPSHTGHGEGVQHPIKLYLWIWGLLFVFSAFSYMVDYFQLQGVLRWTLIIVFMLIKASFIVAIFMHMAWERLALKLAILIPPLTLLVLIGLMAIEGDYTFLTRIASFVH